MTANEEHAQRIVGEVLDRLEREYGNASRSNPLPRGDDYAAGYLAGIDTAHQWIKNALGGTP